MRRWSILAWALAAIAAAPPAGALEEDTWTFGVGGGLAYDDNLLRLPSDASPARLGVGDRPRGTWVMNGFARVAFDGRASRQRFRGFVQGNLYRFGDYSYLDWQGVDLNATWLWEAGNRWNGTLAYDRVEFLSGLADFTALVQNLRSVETARANAEYWLHPRWRLTGGFTGTFLRNSSAALRGTNLDQYAYGAGFKYVSTQQNFVVFGARYTRGEYPERAAPSFIADNRFTQYDVGVDLSWAVGGKAELLGNIAYTRRELPNIPSRDFSGPTGNLRLVWRASGKTGIDALLQRGIGAVDDVTANYIVTDTARLAPYWLASDKVRLDAYYQYQRRDYQGDPGLVSGLPQREDRLRFAGLGARWQPSRNWQVGLNYVYSTRSSNYPSLDFTDNTLSATVQFAW
jgi:exopolysaccharide biosynthesis operon protein EpsL